MIKGIEYLHVTKLQSRKEEVESLISKLDGNMIKISVGIVEIFDGSGGRTISLHDKTAWFDHYLEGIKDKLNDKLLALLQSKLRGINRELSKYISDIEADYEHIDATGS